MTDRQWLTLPGRLSSTRGRRARPLLPARARRPAAVVAFGCLVLVIVLGAVTAHHGHGTAVDRATYSWIAGFGVPHGTLELVSRLGGVTSVTALTVVLALACLAVRRVSGAVLALAGVALASVTTEFVLKPLVHRTISIHHYLSYPSGHTTGLFAVSAVLTVVLLSPPSGRPRPAVRAAAVAVAVIVSCTVGLTMVGLGYHYLTDVIAGAAVGTGAVLGTAFLLDLAAPRLRPTTPGR